MIVPEVSVHELHEAWSRAGRDGAGLWLIDVRTLGEWQQAHVPGARHRPLDRLAEWQAELPEEETVYMFCHSGMRSAQAAAWLRQVLGRSNVVNVAGGILAWARAGYPIESGCKVEEV